MSTLICPQSCDTDNNIDNSDLHIPKQMQAGKASRKDKETPATMTSEAGAAPGAPSGLINHDNDNNEKKLLLMGMLPQLQVIDSG